VPVKTGRFGRLAPLPAVRDAHRRPPPWLPTHVLHSPAVSS